MQPQPISKIVRLASLTAMLASASTQTWASLALNGISRVTCPVPEVTENFERSDYPEIVVVNPGIKHSHFNQFMLEFKKIPGDLIHEMKEMGGRTHLIYGDGVTADPTWDKSLNFTGDGRNWDTIPGAGGYPYLRYPTRVVVNKLYEGTHGSVNLVLHEHGHALDSTYKHFGVSQSPAWRAMMADEQVLGLLNQLCGFYCSSNAVEAFAELFAYYHACDESRRYLEDKAPVAASFFRDFRSALEFSRSRRTYR